ncbi:MAG TPA: ABC transporter permease [Candidatus Acidoferrales bacterium]|nr:ABC transporter permease [Candidatus Acidoferrales bacterium]
MMERILRDLRYGMRMARKSRAFTAVAVITLALGIGANTAVFSIVNGVLLNPLPFPQSDELVALGENKANFENGSISYPNFRDWQKDNRSFSSMAISRVFSFSLIGAGEPEQVDGDLVSSDFFSILGVKPVAGRLFLAGEDNVGSAPVALIGEDLWHRKFSSSPDILGKNIRLGPKGYTVVGIIPASFHLRLPSFRDGEIFVPAGQWDNPLLLHRDAGLGFHGIARLKPAVTVQQARADMDALSRNLAAAFPDTDKGISANLLPLKQQMVGGVRPLLLVLLAAVGFVLLIACLNVANLMLARSTVRAREFAIRAALGATQGRVVCQLLAESVLLGLIGGTIGLLLAAWGTRAALATLPSTLPRAEQIGLDAHVLIFTAGTATLAGILFGLTPALKMSHRATNDTLKEGGRSNTGRRHRAQGVFVVTEMAMALVLLAGAGLMVRSFARLWQIDPGFDPHHVMSFGLTPPPSVLTAGAERIRAHFRDLNRRLGAIPGVEAVAQTSGAAPLDYDDEQLFWLQGHARPANDNDMDWAISYIVDPDYLKIMKTPLLAGRFFSAQDDEHSPKVVVVDEVFAKKFFPGRDPVGKRIYLKTGNQLAEIVGVVGHVKQWGLDSDDTQQLRAELYIPEMQMPDDYIGATSSTAFVIRVAGDPAASFASVRHVAQEMSDQQVIYGEETMEQVLSRSIASHRFLMILLAAFAALALILASVGIYGVVSYLVGQRTHEIGVRMALGAQRTDVLRLILGGSARLVLSGIVIGVLGAIALTRVMANQLFEVSASDPVTFVAVSLLLMFVALGACYVPARRASNVDPMVALRYE